MTRDSPADTPPGSTPDEPRDLDPETFEQFVDEYDLVLIDVWAEWCGPCLEMEPAIDELAAEMDDLAVGKVDHEAHPDLMTEYRSLIGSVVSSLPALFVFSDGDCVERLTGRQSKAELRSTVGAHR